jgi:N-acetylglucosaminyldiphosphoundecaprenol N-acetyl-beta-D-mannosaminyltransferase
MSASESLAVSSTARPFGLRLSTDSAGEIARRALTDRRRPEDGVALVVTPNIDHIAWLRRSPAMARAYASAAAVVCDGWPVQLYARLRGLPVRRVTGCEITSELMRGAPGSDGQRFFFVADRAETETALYAWAEASGLTRRVAVFVPPFGFELNERLCRGLAETILAHATTVLVMGVGAPRSEIFVDQWRHVLPPCWAFCVGQAIKIELGLVRRAPNGLQHSGLEWLWRVAQEPRRLTGRYLRSSLSFGLAVLDDLRKRPTERGGMV